MVYHRGEWRQHRGSPLCSQAALASFCSSGNSTEFLGINMLSEAYVKDIPGRGKHVCKGPWAGANIVCVQSLGVRNVGRQHQEGKGDR